MQTPQLLADVVIPDHATVMGMRVDLTPLQKLVSAGSSGLAAAGKLVQGMVSPEVGSPLLPGPRRGAIGALAHACTAAAVGCGRLRQAALPDGPGAGTLRCRSAPLHPLLLQVPVSGPASERLSMWMTTTYLDGGLRVARDEAGKVYVMLKDGGEL